MEVIVLKNKIQKISKKISDFLDTMMETKYFLSIIAIPAFIAVFGTMLFVDKLNSFFDIIMPYTLIIGILSFLILEVLEILGVVDYVCDEDNKTFGSFVLINIAFIMFSAVMVVWSVGVSMCLYLIYIIMMFIFVNQTMQIVLLSILGILIIKYIGFRIKLYIRNQG